MGGSYSLATFPKKELNTQISHGFFGTNDCAFSKQEQFAPRGLNDIFSRPA